MIFIEFSHVFPRFSPRFCLHVSRVGARNATELLDDLCELSVARTVARLVSGAAYGDARSSGAELPEAEAEDKSLRRLGLNIIKSTSICINTYIYIYMLQHSIAITCYNMILYIVIDSYSIDNMYIYIYM